MEEKGRDREKERNINVKIGLEGSEEHVVISGLCISNYFVISSVVSCYLEELYRSV